MNTTALVFKICSSDTTVFPNKLLPQILDLMDIFVMSNQCDNGYFEWRPGAWIKCEATQERGQIQPYEGKRIRVDLGPGIMLFASSDLLSRMGWEPI